MIRKDKHKFADGSVKTQIRVTQGYRDSVTGKPKQKTIKSFGYLEDYPNQDEFMNMVVEFDKAYKKEKRVIIDKKPDNKPFYENNCSTEYNFGYRFVETIYEELGFEEIFNSMNYKGKNDLNEIFKFLVIQRILNPDSKRATYQDIENYYLKNYDFHLYDIYRSLDYFYKENNKIQKHINDFIKERIGRDTSEVFYDTTNYFFQHDLEDEDVYEEVTPVITDKKIIKKQKLINIEDSNGTIHQFKKISGLCKRGVSKEHVVDPIIQLGLLIDKNGLPINMQLFPGNTSDSLTLIPSLDEVKNDYDLDRIVVVADKGMNSNDNIDKICNNGDGYMFSQILKGKKGKRYQDRLFDESLYTVVNEKYKYQLFEEEYNGTDINGKKTIRKRKVLIYWNGDAAKRDKKKRDEKIKKAEKSLANNAYMLNHGNSKYIKTEKYVLETGEIATENISSIDYEKAKNEELYDGYFAIVTSELHFDEKKIREIYHGLWRIEDSFRITKSDLEARPVFVRTENHIKAHFLICYVALVIIRILQYKMNYSLSVERVVRAMQMCACCEISKGTIHVVKAKSKKQYIIKTDKNGNEYYSLKLSEFNDETVEDFKLLIKYFKFDCFASLENKSKFDKILNAIKIIL